MEDRDNGSGGSEEDMEAGDCAGLTLGPLIYLFRMGARETKRIDN